MVFLLPQHICSGILRKFKDIFPSQLYLTTRTSYTYERSRQAAILLREVARFRHGLGKDNWPCIIAGGKKT